MYSRDRCAAPAGNHAAARRRRCRSPRRRTPGAPSAPTNLRKFEFIRSATCSQSSAARARITVTSTLQCARLTAFAAETVASTGPTRQTARGIRKALRETLPVIRHARTLHCDWPHSMRPVTRHPAHADSVRVFTGSLGGTSDFVFRGLSLTRGKPAAQASLDIEFPKEFYVGAFVATADPNPRPEPDRRNGCVGRPLLAHLGEFLGRPAAVAVHLSRRPAARQLQPHRAHRHARVSQPAYSRGYLLPQHQGGRLLAPATTKATPGRWSFPAASRSTNAWRFPRASATTGSTRSTTTATTTGTRR